MSSLEKKYLKLILQLFLDIPILGSFQNVTENKQI